MRHALHNLQGLFNSDSFIKLELPHPSSADEELTHGLWDARGRPCMSKGHVNTHK